jgi:thiosulfate/3-mercaptopyruvate sulfurtransferase
MTARGTLVSTDELAANRGSWRVFDCRHDLVDPAIGARQYAEAHIPGAAFASLDRDLSAPKSGTNGRHPLPDAGAFLAWLGRQGLRREDQVVCYDASGGTYASRLWWMLRWVGHWNVAVLDGGYAKWVKEGRPVSAEVPHFAPLAYAGAPDPSMCVDVAYIEARLGKPEMTIVDARNAQRFAGQGETLDPVGGHIPGALNRFYTANLGADGCFKPADALRAEFSALLGSVPASQVVQQCGSGVSACVNLLAMEHAGLPGSRLYAGSWSEWCASPARPVAR